MLILLQMIPAGSTILLNMTSVLYNEKVFIEPEKFKPQRYLEGDVQKVKQHTIPFGIGELSLTWYYIVYYYMRHIKACTLQVKQQNKTITRHQLFSPVL